MRAHSRRPYGQNCSDPQGSHMQSLCSMYSKSDQGSQRNVQTSGPRLSVGLLAPDVLHRDRAGADGWTAGPAPLASSPEHQTEEPMRWSKVEIAAFVAAATFFGEPGAFIAFA